MKVLGVDRKLLIGAAALGILGVGYVLLKKPAANSANTTGPFQVASGYDPTGGISLPNIGGSQAYGGVVTGASVGNSHIGDTPIGIDPITGQTINTIESGFFGKPIPVDPSSWQGTTNSSGSLTYLNGELAGEGSGIAKLQGVTY